LNFSEIKNITIPEGKVIQIKTNSSVIWSASKENEYTLLDYIIVPTAAWFNTGIVPSAEKWTYETEMYAESWGSNQYFYFAVRQTKSYDTMYAPIHVTSGYRMYLNGNVKTASAGGAKNTWYKIKSEIQDGLQNMWINDVLKVTDDIAITTTYTLPLYLFAANFHGGMYQGTAGRIKYLKATKGDKLIRHFVAAKRNSDEVCGLLDLVENKFYKNAGSGTIKGV
jgi:hypothetical protein